MWVSDKYAHVISKDVVNPLGILDHPLTKPIDGVRIPHSKERLRRVGEVWVEFLDLRGGDWILQYKVDHSTKQMLQVR